MEKIGAIFGAALLIVLMVVIVGLVVAWPVMLLWNGCLVAAVVGVHEIGFWQAWGLVILFGILFKSSSSKSD